MNKCSNYCKPVASDICAQSFVIKVYVMWFGYYFACVPSMILDWESMHREGLEVESRFSHSCFYRKPKLRRYTYSDDDFEAVLQECVNDVVEKAKVSMVVEMDAMIAKKLKDQRQERQEASDDNRQIQSPGACKSN